MTLEEYLPRQPRYVSLRALARVIAKRLRRAATVLAKVFMPFEANPQGLQGVPRELVEWSRHRSRK